MTRQEGKAEAFRALHVGDAFVIPNPWDRGSARVLEALGFKALATTSSGFAFTLGRPDGGATLEEVVAHAADLDAVIDAAVEAGYVDRDRMGLGGHSYGAFSTVNAMTLVPYFKAGIAGDGMYNRSLTPFGFQSERRTFFDAMDTYLDPGHPDAAQWIVNTALSIVANYAVDGINLDRIRYPDGNFATNVPSWGYNPVAISRFQQATGRTDRPAPSARVPA